jgi:hypothetical protein
LFRTTSNMKQIRIFVRRLLDSWNKRKRSLKRSQCTPYSRSESIFLNKLDSCNIRLINSNPEGFWRTKVFPWISIVRVSKSSVDGSYCSNKILNIRRHCDTICHFSSERL